ncbi:MAG: hypothetical protein AAB438_02315 [Patescibacteria group bacterium]
MEKNHKKNVWWFRLSKVLFVILYVVLVGVSLFAVYDEYKPYTETTVDKKNSYIKCNKDSDNSIVYYFDQNTGLDSYLFEKPYELDYFGKERAKQICGFFGYTTNIMTLDEEKGSAVDVIKYSALSLLIIYIFMYLLSSTFLYICFGENFSKPAILEILNNKE